MDQIDRKGDLDSGRKAGGQTKKGVKNRAENERKDIR